jgi:hypothetical protein
MNTVFTVLVGMYMYALHVKHMYVFKSEHACADFQDKSLSESVCEMLTVDIKIKCM